MIQHRVKHLEPIHIEYLNETKHILVTENGSKFYPNDVVYKKSVDLVLQNMDKNDKEMFHFIYNHAPNFKGITGAKLFYLSEKEFDDHCETSLKYLGTSDSEECRALKSELKTAESQEWFNYWDRIELYIEDVAQDKVTAQKIRENLKSRAALKKKDADRREFARLLTVLELAAMNAERGIKRLCDLREYQKLNEGRKVILRIMCDKRDESYDEWFLFCDDILEGCCAILNEEKRLEANTSNLLTWSGCVDQAGRRFITVPQFEEFLKELQIDPTRIILVPDVHFIRQWIELPLRTDYICATIRTPDGEEGYRPIQAQLRLFEGLVCDVDWTEAAKKQPQKTQEMQNKIMEFLGKCMDLDFHSAGKVERFINEMNIDNFFADSKKRKWKTPLYMCLKKKYNDTMPISEFCKLYQKYFHESMPQDGFGKTNSIEIWRFRQIFLNRWIDMFLPKHQTWCTNLKTALTMQFGVADAEKMYHLENCSQIKKMGEQIRVKVFYAPKQNMPQEPTSNAKKPIVKITKKEKKVDNDKATNDQAQLSPIEKIEDEKLKKLVENFALAMNSSDIEEEMKKELNPAMYAELDDKRLKVVEEMMGLAISFDEPVKKPAKIETREIKKAIRKSNKIKQDKSGLETKNDPKIDETEHVVPKIVDLKNCQDELKNENEDLKRQLAEKSKVIEDQGNRLQSDGMRLHEMQKKLEIAQKTIAQQEETAKGLEKSSRAQANKIKEDYKKENRELKAKLTEKEKRCKQLQLELKEVRDNAKKEQRKKNSKEDEELKRADDNMKKMKKELEMAKLTLNANSKTIYDLEKKNRGLEIELEIEKEKIATSSIDAEKDETIRKLTEKCENLELERLGMLADIEELSMRNREFDKLESLNQDLINRLNNLSMEPSNFSAPFADLQNQLENNENFRDATTSSNPPDQEKECLICKEEIETGNQDVLQCERCPVEYHNHCLSQWLEVNSTCPHCQKHWPDPQQFPAL